MSSTSVQPIRIFFAERCISLCGVVINGFREFIELRDYFKLANLFNFLKLPKLFKPTPH